MVPSKQFITSLLEYHGRQAVSTGSLKVLIECLDDVIGTRPSTSPLQVSEEYNVSVVMWYI